VRADDFTRTVRAAREAFLSTGRAEQPVRYEIEASWRRSSVSGVRPELDLLPSVASLVEVNGRLYIAARPALDDLAARLTGTATSILLADKHARVITRWVADASLRRRLDRVNSAEGATLHEEVVGTNGLGSVLAEGRPVRVTGPEHFIDGFQGFACVGAPVRHPLTGQLEGIITLAMRYEDSNELLFPLVLQVAEEIQARLLLQATARERMLLDAFLSTARRSARAVVSMTDQLVITNPAAARVLDGVDHATLWDLASRARSTTGTEVATLTLADGEYVAARLRPVDDGATVFGAVIDFDPQDRDERRRGAAPTTDGATGLPGLVGRSGPWRDAVASARELVPSGVPVVVAGERGTGKLALLESALSLTPRRHDLVVVDGAMASVHGVGAWVAMLERELRSSSVVIVRHLDALSDVAAGALCSTLDSLPTDPARRPWLLGTLIVFDGAPPRFGLRGLLDRMAGARIDMPPLRARLDDVPDLVAALTRRHARTGVVPRWSGEALAMLRRPDWSGNVRELEAIVRRALATVHGPEIRATDLPDEVQRLPLERSLTELERLERDAIRSALRRHGGNKNQAAIALGISRSTLYRKLEAFAPGSL
jgi:transcriptional regulator of acetoin/glycerol metabolism